MAAGEGTDALAVDVLTLLRWFVNHRDYYAVQTPDGWAYCPSRLENDALLGHLAGAGCVGLYPLDADNNVRWCCFDLDTRDPGAVFAVTGQLSPPYLVVDTGGRGRHVWVFFKDPTPAARVRAWAAGVVSRAATTAPVEVYPKQDERGSSTPGQSLIRLPFGVNVKTGKRSTALFGEFGYTELPKYEVLLATEGMMKDLRAVAQGEGWITALFEGDCSAKDGRNNTLNAFRGWLTSRGVPQAFANRWVQEVNENLPNPLTDDELRRTVLRERKG